MRLFRGWGPISAVAVLWGLSASGCASTKLVSTWTAPDFTGAPLKRVAAFVISDDESLRRYAEDQMVQGFPAGTAAVAAHAVVPQSERGDKEKVIARLVGEGFDGALVTRLIEVDRSETYVPPTYSRPAPYYSSFNRYYGYGWREAYSPGYIEVNTVVSVETVLYALPAGKLVWAGTSETFDPETTREVIEGVVQVVVQELGARRLIVPAEEIGADGEAPSSTPGETSPDG